MPGMEARLEKIEGVENGGRLFVRGPNLMKGYLNPDANAKFQAFGGWYDTGDIVAIDEEGFLFIQGRMKRFAKISGEMISLTAVEEALAGAFPQYGLRSAPNSATASARVKRSLPRAMNRACSSTKFDQPFAAADFPTSPFPANSVL